MVPYQFIHRLSSSATVASWNSRIRHVVSSGHAPAAVLLFRQLKQQQLCPDNYTFPFVAKACAKLSDLLLSRAIHADVLKTPFFHHMHVQTAFLDMYVKCGDLDSAHHMFDEMPHRDIASWNAILLGFAQLGNFDRVSLLFNRLRNDDHATLDAVTIMALTQSVISTANDGRLLFCAAVHCLGIKSGFEGDISVANTWISGYAKCGDLCSAEAVFFGIPTDDLSIISWNSMIAGCAYFHHSAKAIEFYRQMNRDMRPDSITLVNLLPAFDQPNYLYHGMLIHALAVKFGCISNISLLNTLIHTYSKCGDINSARSIFDSMTERSCCSWTVMISGYSEQCDIDEALSLFHKMEASRKSPDVVTVISLAAACGKAGALEVGKWIDSYATSKRLKKNVMVCNALLDMYMKCGSIHDAQELFDIMNGNQNIVSWTTLIAGLALNGRFHAALHHFNRMLTFGLKPNHVTFLTVLQACAHGGFLDQGWEIFYTMRKNYGINPGLDHYTCMVDLLGRGGKLQEALKFIQEMPIEADAGIWGALLGACKIHRNVEIGEKAAHKLLQLEPKGAVGYVEMANIYASLKNWNGVADMRVKMKRQQVTKWPGWSMVCVDGERYWFTVEDRFHSKRSRVFETLDGLILQLRDEVDAVAFEETMY